MITKWLYLRNVKKVDMSILHLHIKLKGNSSKGIGIIWKLHQLIQQINCTETISYINLTPIIHFKYWNQHVRTQYLKTDARSGITDYLVSGLPVLGPALSVTLRDNVSGYFIVNKARHKLFPEYWGPNRSSIEYCKFYATYA